MAGSRAFSALSAALSLCLRRLDAAKTAYLRLRQSLFFTTP